MPIGGKGKKMTTMSLQKPNLCYCSPFPNHTLENSSPLPLSLLSTSNAVQLQLENLSL